jgi:hypothetical protein
MFEEADKLVMNTKRSDMNEGLAYRITAIGTDISKLGYLGTLS